MNQPEELNQPEDLNQPDEAFAELEERLTQALCRVDPPEGFADRLMARAEPSKPVPAKVIRMTPRRAWASGAIAALVLVGAFAGEQTHLRHQRERAELAQQQRAEAAQRQFEAGIRITDETLDHARAQLARAGIELRD